MDINIYIVIYISFTINHGQILNCEIMFFNEAIVYIIFEAELKILL